MSVRCPRELPPASGSCNQVPAPEYTTYLHSNKSESTCPNTFMEQFGINTHSFLFFQRYILWSKFVINASSPIWCWNIQLTTPLTQPGGQIFNKQLCCLLVVKSDHYGHLMLPTMIIICVIFVSLWWWWSSSSTSAAGNEWQELQLLTPHNHIIHQSSSSPPSSSSTILFNFSLSLLSPFSVLYLCPIDYFSVMILRTKHR